MKNHLRVLLIFSSLVLYGCKKDSLIKQSDTVAIDGNWQNINSNCQAKITIKIDNGIVRTINNETHKSSDEFLIETITGNNNNGNFTAEQVLKGVNIKYTFEYSDKTILLKNYEFEGNASPYGNLNPYELLNLVRCHK